MKTSLKIFLLAVALIVMNGCSAQRRAERHLRRAVELCPELAQVKARPIDTTLFAPAWADRTSVPLAQVLGGETVYTATDHGTVVVSLGDADSTLRVGFVAAPQPVRYRDTLRWRELDPARLQPEKTGNSFWHDLALWIIGIGMGMGAAIWLLRNAIKR